MPRIKDSTVNVPEQVGADRLAAIFQAAESMIPLHVLLARLNQYRWTGRPGYSLRGMMRAYLASFILNLPHTNALIRLLEDDPALRAVCGFHDGLPHRRTLNRFVRRLRIHANLVERVLASVTNRLKEHLPDLGDEVAIDATAIRTHSNPNRKHISDSEAWWGWKHSARAKEGGTEYFFGYKSHVVADVKYEVPLALLVTPGNQNDSRMLSSVMRQGERLYKWWRPKVLIADRGYDALSNHKWLDARGILPIIHIRKAMNKEKLYDGIYTEEGVPTCVGGIPMKYITTDPETGKRYYMCPEEGCHLRHHGKLKNGITHCDFDCWEDPKENLRLFGKIPRHSKEWKAHYRKRQGIERVFKRLKESRRLERHCVRGREQITLHTLMSVLAYQLQVLVKVEAGEMDTLKWQVRKVD